ncbi:hypothetical protein Deba_2511 [Desulfarculus baarsii DSM 2075]|uniref:Nitrile hydratase alpha/Thiocyanate hydrolase gamma domain-containing protein n=1 Tax=Desulfarculus baarsii (strain ATCC 33931 / DSM 2075 / LMG 7858 / VKM B-1802 / 2st14) TaxID=644282 RepID=E1QJX8_DESB2|nr:NHLP leader peptide family RiPP precursor [Desulfarculus baarsii]ADK85871.1 hypothetical protein Deba_2511 [Desulfarculus baarsii DSM 2075]
MSSDNMAHSSAWAKVVAKAWADESYKNKLLSDPAAVLRAEGLAIPEGVRLTVLENSATQIHLVLPVAPSDAADLEDAALGERLAAVI